MIPAEGFRATLEALGDVLERLGLRYHLTGGIVSVLYGEPRLTQDVDVVVDPDRATACSEELVRGLAGAGFELNDETARNAIRDGGMFQILDVERVVKVDLYVRCLVPGELDRSVPGELFEGRTFPVVARVDAVLSKLIWIGHGSHRSRRDLRRLFDGATAEERDRIRRMAAESELADLLAEVLAESDEIDA